MASRQNKLFFGMLHTAFSTNSNIDWAFKSNLVHFVGLTDTLQQSRSVKNSPIADIMKYLYDVKPYHTYFTSIIEQWITKNEDMFVTITDELSTEIELKYENVLYEPELSGFDCLPFDAEAPGLGNKGLLNTLYNENYWHDNSTGNKSINVLDANGNYDEEKYESDPDYYVSKEDFDKAPGKYGYFGNLIYDIPEESLQYGCFDKPLTSSDIKVISNAIGDSTYNTILKYFEDPYYYDNLANKLYFLHPTYEFDKISRMLGNEYKLTILTPYVNNYDYSVIFNGKDSYIAAKDYNTEQIEHDKNGFDGYSFNYDLYDFLTYENQYFIANDLSDDSYFKEFTSEYINAKKVYGTYIGTFNTEQLQKLAGVNGNIAYNINTNTEWKCNGVIDNPKYLGEVYYVNEITITPELGSIVDVYKTHTEWEYQLISYYLGTYTTTSKVESLTKLEGYFCDNLETGTEWKCETTDNPKYLGVFGTYVGEYQADYEIYDINTNNLTVGDFCDNLETGTEWEYSIIAGINSTSPVFDWVDTRRVIGTTPKSKFYYNPSAKEGDIIVDKHYMETPYRNSEGNVFVNRWYPYYIYKGIGWIDTNELVSGFTPEENIWTSCDVLYTKDLDKIVAPALNNWVNNYETGTEWRFENEAKVNEAYIGEFDNEYALMDLVKIRPSESGKIVDIPLGSIADNLETGTEWKYQKKNTNYVGIYYNTNMLPNSQDKNSPVYLIEGPVYACVENDVLDDGIIDNNVFYKWNGLNWERSNPVIHLEDVEVRRDVIVKFRRVDPDLDPVPMNYNGFIFGTVTKWFDTRKLIGATPRYFSGWVDTENPIGTTPDEDELHKKEKNGIWVSNVNGLNNLPNPQFGYYVKNYETHTWWIYYYKWENTYMGATDETVYKSLEWVDTENPIGTTPYSSEGWADTGNNIGTTPHSIISWVDTENPIGTTDVKDNKEFPAPTSTFESEKLVVYVTDLISNICTLQSSANYEIHNNTVIFNEPIPYNNIVKICALDYSYLYDMIYSSNGDSTSPDIIINGTGMDRPYVGKKGSEQIDLRVIDGLSMQVLTNSMMVDNPIQGFDTSPFDMLAWDIGSEDNDNYGGGINIEEQTFTNTNYQELPQQPLDNNSILSFIDGLYNEQFDIIWNTSLHGSVLSDHKLNPQVRVDDGAETEKTLISYGVDYLNLVKQYKVFNTQERTFVIESEFPESNILVTVNGNRVGFEIVGTTIGLLEPLSEPSDVIIYTFSNTNYERLDKFKYSGASEYDLEEVSSLGFPQCYSDLFVFDNNGKKLNPVFMKWILIDDANTKTYDLPVLDSFSGEILVYLDGSSTQYKTLNLVSDTAYTINDGKITFNYVSKNTSYLIVCNDNSNDYSITNNKARIILNQNTDITTYQITNSINIGIRLDVIQVTKDNLEIPVYDIPYDYNDIFVWVDGNLLSGHNYNYSYKKLTLSENVIVDDDMHIVQIMYNSNSIALPPVCVQQVVTNKDEIKYFRLSDKYSTVLMNDFRIHDNYIEVDAANVLTQPTVNLDSPRLSIPGRILVNGEIIEFWDVDYNTTPHRLLNITRGVYGTGYSGNSNVLFNKMHLKGSIIYDLGDKQAIYTNKKDLSSRTINHKVVENWETNFDLTNNKNIKPYYNIPGVIENNDTVKVWCNPIIETLSDLDQESDKIILTNTGAINEPSPTTLESTIGEYILDRCPSRDYVWWRATTEMTTQQWAAGVDYSKGEVVIYDGIRYKALRNVPKQKEFTISSNSGMYTLTKGTSLIVTIDNGLNPNYIKETINVTTNDLEEFINNTNEYFNEKYPSLGITFKYIVMTYPEYGTVFRVTINRGYTVTLKNGIGYPLQEIFGGAYYSAIPAENIKKGNGIIINGQNIIFADPTIKGTVARINSFSMQTNVGAVVSEDGLSFEIVSLDGKNINLDNLTEYDDLGNLGLPNVIYGSSEIYINKDNQSVVNSVRKSFISIKINNQIINYQVLIEQGSEVTLWGLKNTKYWEYIKDYNSVTDFKYRFWYAGNKYSAGTYIIYDNKVYKALVDIPVLQEFEEYGNDVYETIPSHTKFSSPRFVEVDKSEYVIDDGKLTFNNQPELESIIRIQNTPNKDIVIIGNNIQKGYNDISKFLLKAPFYESL